jgi:hypothetical protein
MAPLYPQPVQLLELSMRSPGEPGPILYWSRLIGVNIPCPSLSTL